MGMLRPMLSADVDTEPVRRTAGNDRPASTMALDAMTIWRQVAEKLGGLAAEKAIQASSAAIRRQINWSSPSPRSIISANSSANGPRSIGQIAEHVRQIVGRTLQLSFATEQDLMPTETEPTRRATVRQRIYEVSQRPFARQAMELFDASPQRLEEPGTA